VKDEEKPSKSKERKKDFGEGEPKTSWEEEKGKRFLGEDKINSQKNIEIDCTEKGRRESEEGGGKSDDKVRSGSKSLLEVDKSRTRRSMEEVKGGKAKREGELEEKSKGKREKGVNEGLGEDKGVRKERGKEEGEEKHKLRKEKTNEDIELKTDERGRRSKKKT